MSLATWKEEFYPVPADEAKGDALAAVDHSLKKWEGLRPDNLKKHQCRAAGTAISDGAVETVTEEDEYMALDCTSCALCKYNDAHGGNYCDNCPITMATGQPCDDGYGDREDEDGLAPWDEWTSNTNPEAMIAVLETTRKWLLGQLEEQDERHEER